MKLRKGLLRGAVARLRRTLGRLARCLHRAPSERPAERTRRRIDEGYEHFRDLTRTPELREIRFAGGAAIVTLNDGRRYHWNPLEPAARMYTVPITGTFEAKETAFVRSTVSTSWVCVDVGANFGWYTVLLSRLCGDAGRVHAFEPVPDTYELLQRNLELNECANVVTNRAALDAAQARKELYIPDIGVSGSFALHPFDRSYRAMSVETRTLDDYVEAQGLERLDFVKADIEGAELGLLQGAKRTLSRFGPVLMLEVQRSSTTLFGYEPSAVFRELEPFGYSAFTVNGQGGLAAFDDPRGELPDYNFVFKR